MRADRYQGLRVSWGAVFLVAPVAGNTIPGVADIDLLETAEARGDAPVREIDNSRTQNGDLVCRSTSCFRLVRCGGCQELGLRVRRTATLHQPRWSGRSA